MPSLRSRQIKSTRRSVKLSVKFIDTYIGSGVFAEEDIKKGSWICFYEGLLISGKEGLKRFSSLPDNQGSFLFFFCHKGQDFCVDATYSQGYGRMINDSSKPNCKVVVEQKKELKLAIYTIKDIEKGSELRFNYNDTTVYWRKTETSEAADSDHSIQTYASEAVNYQTETSKAAFNADSIKTKTSDASDSADSIETETSEAVQSQTETSEAIEGPSPIQTVTSEAFHSETATCETAASADSIMTVTREAIYSQTKTSAAVEVGPGPFQTLTSEADNSETAICETAASADSIETLTRESIYSQAETSEAVEVGVSQTDTESYIEHYD